MNKPPHIFTLRDTLYNKPEPVKTLSVIKDKAALKKCFRLETEEISQLNAMCVTELGPTSEKNCSGGHFGDNLVKFECRSLFEVSR